MLFHKKDVVIHRICGSCESHKIEFYFDLSLLQPQSASILDQDIKPMMTMVILSSNKTTLPLTNMIPSIFFSETQDEYNDHNEYKTIFLT